MPLNPIILWFRSDLRLVDNPALDAAIKSKAPVIPLFIWEQTQQSWEPGAASKWWLHQSLSNLSKKIKKLGGQIYFRSGDPLQELKNVFQESGANFIVWNRRYEPENVPQDQKIKKQLETDGIEVKSYNSHLLAEPWEISNQSGKPYRVFTPFWKTLQNTLGVRSLTEPAKKINFYKGKLRTLKLADLSLEPQIDWAGGMRNAWRPGEEGAQENLKIFIKDTVENYLEGRDVPDQNSTSRLSPHLHFGEIGPAQIWHQIQEHIKEEKRKKTGANTRKNGIGFLREVAWREFAYHLLFHFSHTPKKPLRPEYEKFPWKNQKKDLKAWQQGKTGYPLVDAGMRELWHTGWMHNRVRMITASFLVKDLLIPWQRGAEWFWDTLVDADLANNTLGWQWVAGCGADAAPFFRIFNPTTQAEKFDPQGNYIRRWIPELAKLPTPWLFHPWDSPPEILKTAGLALGQDYPYPIVEHSFARKRALDALQKIK